MVQTGSGLNSLSSLQHPVWNGSVISGQLLVNRHLQHKKLVLSAMAPISRSWVVEGVRERTTALLPKVIFTCSKFLRPQSWRREGCTGPGLTAFKQRSILNLYGCCQSRLPSHNATEIWSSCPFVQTGKRKLSAGINLVGTAPGSAALAA